VDNVERVSKKEKSILRKKRRRVRKAKTNMWVDGKLTKIKVKRDGQRKIQL
jgi:hypothetical protein